MFVATKKQAKEIVSECAKRVNMPFVTERWLGGMLTNFNTVRKSVKKMQSIEKMLGDGSAENLTKKERLTLTVIKIKWKKYWVVLRRSAVYLQLCSWWILAMSTLHLLKQSV